MSNVSDANDEPNIIADIQEAEEILQQIEKDIRKLWKEVIIPYKQDQCRAQILDNLTELDYDKFYQFMIQNNETYQKMIKYLDYLNVQNQILWQK